MGSSVPAGADRRATTTVEAESVTENVNYGFGLSWEIDLFGKLRRQRESALAIAFASEQNRRGVLVTLIGDVASTYFLLREFDLQIDIARRTLALNDETVAYFRNRLDGGVSNRLEVDRIVANRAQTAAALPDIERQRAYAENLLSFLLGRGPGPITRTALTLGETLPPTVPPGLPAQLLERRPDVALAEQLLVAANADIGAAKALFFPTLSLTGFLGGVNGDLTSLLGGGGAVWSLTPSLLQPIFNAGRLKQNVQVMQARFDAAIAEYRKVGAERLSRSRQRPGDHPEAGGDPRAAAHRGRGPDRRRRPGACPIRFRARELPGDPDRRPGAVHPAALAGADPGRRAPRPRGALSHARRRLANDHATLKKEKAEG